jgi:hypothetical protein
MKEKLMASRNHQLKISASAMIINQASESNEEN